MAKDTHICTGNTRQTLLDWMQGNSGILQLMAIQAHFAGRLASYLISEMSCSMRVICKADPTHSHSMPITTSQHHSSAKDIESNPVLGALRTCL